MAWKPLLVTFITLSSLAGLTVGAAVSASDEEASVPPDATVVSVDCASFAATPAATRSVAVAPGASILLSLCSNPTTGYRWSEPMSSDPTVASVGGWSYTAPDSSLLGASGAENVAIPANAPGTALITASYDQPWDGGDKGAWTIELTVEVRESSTLAIGCDEFEATPAVSRSVELAAGTSLVLSLCSNPSTGFRWSDAVSSDPAVAAVSSWIFEEPSSETGMVGAAGLEHLTVDAKFAGNTVITASYDQPWDGGAKGAWSLELNVSVD